MSGDSTEPGTTRRSAFLRAMARKVYRDGILEAAEKVFARAGFADTRMADVAAEAGLAIGTLYNYFANRDALLSSLIERRAEDLLAALHEAEERTRDPVGQIEELVRASFAYFESHRPLFAIFLEPGSISGKSMAAIVRRCGNAQHALYTPFTRAIERAAAAGVLRADLPRPLVLGALIGSLHSVIRLWMSSPRREPLVDQARLVVDIFLRGAGTPS